MVRLGSFFLLFALAVSAQPLRVFSEFVRFGPDGEPSSPATPREILSPAVARNSFATFQILVKGDPEKTSSLWVGQNPENSFQVTLYREENGRLTKVSEPVEIKGTEAIWMDVWVKRDTPVSRIKLEPELYVNQDWVLYPMEVRVEEATVPEAAGADGLTSPLDVMRAFVCGTRLGAGREAGAPLTRASLSYRNAVADVALARQAPQNELKNRFGQCDQPAGDNPESYLRIRDYLLRLR